MKVKLKNEMQEMKTVKKINEKLEEWIKKYSTLNILWINL